MNADAEISEEAWQAARKSLWQGHVEDAERAVKAAAPHIARAAQIALLLEMADEMAATKTSTGLYLAAGYREKAAKLEADDDH